MKADLQAMTASRKNQPVNLKLNTSLCYNPDKERLTITIYDLEGLEVIHDLSKNKIFEIRIFLTFERN